MRRDLLLCASLVGLFAACDGGEPAAPRATTEEPGPAAPIAAPPSIASPKSNVRFLDAPRLGKTFARVLGLSETELCNELGQYSCVGIIHGISLLGTDPYVLGVNDPLPSTMASTPLVVERVATSGCVLRVARDRAPIGAKAHPSALEGALFRRLAVDDAGKLDPESPEVKGTIDELYVRALQRHATPAEIEHLRQLYRDVEALPSPRPAEDWAVASCVAVLTSMESLFY